MATQRNGDVAARVAVRFDEVFESLRLIRALCAGLPAGAVRTELPAPAGAPVGAGWVEGWRGEVLVRWRLGADGRIRALPLPRPVVAELAGARARGDRQHRSGLPAHQQVLQPELFGTRPLDVAHPQPDRPHRHRHRAAADSAGDAPTTRPRRSASSDDLLDILGQALTIRQVDAGSCNGCELEIHALNNPYYNIEGLGIKFVASPRHADMLLVTGPVSRHMEEALRRTYDATPEPQAGGRGGRLRLHRRHLRRELCQLRPGGQRDSGRRRRARLPARPPLEILRGILARGAPPGLKNRPADTPARHGGSAPLPPAPARQRCGYDRRALGRAHRAPASRSASSRCRWRWPSRSPRASSPRQGIFTAIIAGFLISALGGSSVQIGGPAGAFIVIVYGIVRALRPDQPADLHRAGRRAAVRDGAAQARRAGALRPGDDHHRLHQRHRGADRAVAAEGPARPVDRQDAGRLLRADRRRCGSTSTASTRLRWPSAWPAWRWCCCGRKLFTCRRLPSGWSGQARAAGARLPGPIVALVTATVAAVVAQAAGGDHRLALRRHPAVAAGVRAARASAGPAPSSW